MLAFYCMGEFELIDKYFKVPHARKDVVMGPGDDCALLTLPPDTQLAVSTDTLVSGVHFFPDMDPVDLGYKALAVNLSDLAAMGAEPRWVSLALTLPAINEELGRRLCRRVSGAGRVLQCGAGGRRHDPRAALHHHLGEGVGACRSRPDAQRRQSR